MRVLHELSLKYEQGWTFADDPGVIPDPVQGGAFPAV